MDDIPFAEPVNNDPLPEWWTQGVPVSNVPIAEHFSAPATPVNNLVVQAGGTKAVEGQDESKKPKVVARDPTSPGYYNHWANTGYLQMSHQTKKERFPKIFDALKELKPDAKRILSFGCSTGEECFSLAERFPNAEIVGVDIDYYSVQTARKKNKADNIYFHTDVGATGTYDVLTCLMVLFCMEFPITEAKFAELVKKFPKMVNPNGVAVLYTCQFKPTTVPEFTEAFEPIREWTRIHDRDQKEYWCGYYRRK